MKTSPCRSCGELMIWCRTQKGKRNPMDAEPSDHGTFQLVEQDDPEGPLAVYNPNWSGEKHLSHFTTCAHADQHRRSK